ncbi:MAG: oxidoreductase [Brevundimonas sp.]|nr:MAG: oxidoreductase [Brevundimonas sp.]
MTDLNVGLVGYGYVGKTFHAPLISATPGLRLAGVVSSRPDDVAAAWPDAVVHPRLEALLASKPDLVVIATPNDLHEPQARAALRAGCAVVVDKPFTLTVAEAEGLERLADETGRLLSVFHNRRWDGEFLTLKGLIADGSLGTIRRFESHIDRFRPQVRDRWRENAGPGAGLWFDLGPHLVDQALQLFGWPEAITADLATLRPGGQSTDYVHVVLRYPAMRAILHADVTSPAPELRMAVQGDRGGWIKTGMDVQEVQLKAGMTPGATGWGVDPRPGVLTDGATGRRRETPGQAGGQQAYYAAVAAALRGEGPNPVTAAEAIQVMRVIEAGERSARERRDVAL